MNPKTWWYSRLAFYSLRNSLCNLSTFLSHIPSFPFLFLSEGWGRYYCNSFRPISQTGKWEKRLSRLLKLKAFNLFSSQIYKFNLLYYVFCWSYVLILIALPLFPVHLRKIFRPEKWQGGLRRITADCEKWSEIFNSFFSIYLVSCEDKTPGRLLYGKHERAYCYSWPYLTVVVNSIVWNTVIVQKVSNSMEPSPIWKADSRLDSKNNRVHKISSLNRMQSQNYPVRIIHYLFKIHFNIITVSAPISPRWYVALRFSYKMSNQFFIYPSVLHTPPLISAWWWW